MSPQSLSGSYNNMPCKRLGMKSKLFDYALQMIWPTPHLTFISAPSSWSSLLRSCPFFCPVTIGPFWCYKVLSVQWLWLDASPLLASQANITAFETSFLTTLQREVHATPFFLQFSLFPSFIEISIYFIFVSVDLWLGINFPHWTMAESENDLFHKRD